MKLNYFKFLIIAAFFGPGVLAKALKSATAIDPTDLSLPQASNTTQIISTINPVTQLRKRGTPARNGYHSSDYSDSSSDDGDPWGFTKEGNAEFNTKHPEARKGQPSTSNSQPPASGGQPSKDSGAKEPMRDSYHSSHYTDSDSSDGDPWDGLFTKEEIADRIADYNAKHPDSMKPSPLSDARKALENILAVDDLRRIQRAEKDLAADLSKLQVEHGWRKAHHDATKDYGARTVDDEMLRLLENGKKAVLAAEEQAIVIKAQIEKLEAETGVPLVKEKIVLNQELDRLADNQKMFESEDKSIRKKIQDAEGKHGGKASKPNPPKENKPSSLPKVPEKLPVKPQEPKPAEKSSPKPQPPKENSPPAPASGPDMQRAKHALSDLSKTGHMTDAIASELIASGFDMHPSAQGAAEKMGAPANNETAAQGIVSGMAALPYLPEAAGFLAEAPEIAEVAAIAGSPEILAAAGVAMAAPEIAQAAKSLTPLVHGAGGAAVASEEEAAQAAIVSAQVAGVLGQTGVNELAAGTTTAEKAAGEILGGTLKVGSVAAAGVGGVVGGLAGGLVGGVFGGLFGAHHHKDKGKGDKGTTLTEVKMQTATKIRTLTNVETSIVEHIKTVIQGHTTTAPAKTVMVTVTSTEKASVLKTSTKKTSESKHTPTTLTTKSKPTPATHSTELNETSSSKKPEQTPKIPVVAPIPIPVPSVQGHKNNTTPSYKSSIIPETKSTTSSVTQTVSTLAPYSNGTSQAHLTKTKATKSKSIKTKSTKPVAQTTSETRGHEDNKSSSQTTSSIDQTNPASGMKTMSIASTDAMATSSITLLEVTESVRFMNGTKSHRRRFFN
jgi:hypothetical protein